MTREADAVAPLVVSLEEWQRQRHELLQDEKAVTRILDALAAKRRRLPMVQLGTGYVFATPEGPKTLLDIFDDRDQLVVYQFMDEGTNAYCPGCTHFTNNVADLVTLHGTGITFVMVSNMPLDQIQEYKERMGWTMPFVSSRGNSFAEDSGAGNLFQLSVFLRNGADVYLTYSTTARGVDRLVFSNNVLDLTAYGRQEDWEDSPTGWPQHPTYG